MVFSQFCNISLLRGIILGADNLIHPPFITGCCTEHTAHQMKVYQDFGQGFSEENSYVLEVKDDFYGRRRFALNIPLGVTALRLDPCEEACQVTVNRILGECGGSYELTLGHNGRKYDQSILYTTTDPQILINGIVPGTGQIHVDITVEYLKEETSYG